MLFKTMALVAESPKPLGSENINGGLIIKNVSESTVTGYALIATSIDNLVALDYAEDGVTFPNAFILKPGDILIIDYLDDLENIYGVAYNVNDDYEVVLSICSLGA